MLVLITYDVNTQTVAGRTRLRKVAKECTNKLQDPEQLLQTVIDVIKYASCGISPDRLMVSPELWEWIKTEVDKYNSFQSLM